MRRLSPRLGGGSNESRGGETVLVSGTWTGPRDVSETQPFRMRASSLVVLQDIVSFLACPNPSIG